MKTEKNILKLYLLVAIPTIVFLVIHIILSSTDSKYTGLFDLIGLILIFIEIFGVMIYLYKD